MALVMEFRRRSIEAEGGKKEEDRNKMKETRR
jgi:hypothetical protein